MHYQNGYAAGYYSGELANEPKCLSPEQLIQYRRGYFDGRDDYEAGLPAKPEPLDLRQAEAFALGYHHARTDKVFRGPFGESLPEMRKAYEKGFQTGAKV